MEQLVAQVPELKLIKKVETRTTHYKDIQEAQFLKTPVGKEGEVLQLEFWFDDTGKQWTRSDVLYYMKLMECIDRFNNAPKSTFKNKTNKLAEVI